MNIHFDLGDKLGTSFPSKEQMTHHNNHYFHGYSNSSFFSILENPPCLLEVDHVKCQRYKKKTMSTYVVYRLISFCWD